MTPCTGCHSFGGSTSFCYVGTSLWCCMVLYCKRVQCWYTLPWESHIIKTRLGQLTLVIPLMRAFCY